MNMFRAKSLSLQSDEELMQLIRRGKTLAFDELYNRYNVRLLRYFHKMLGRDEERAQDLLHDLFLKIVERPELYTPGRAFSTWIFSAAHNMCKNEYRSRQIRRPAEVEIDELAVGAEGMLERIDHDSFRHLLGLELDALDEEHRTTFLLRYQEGFSIREISAVLGCPEGTVKSRIFYTVRRLAGKLGQFNPERAEL